MKNPSHYLLALFLIIITTSCMSKSGAPSQSPNDITEKTWRLVELNGKPIALKNPKSNPHFSLNMKEMRYEGNGSCNGIGGTFEIKPEIMHIKFNQGMSTMMACDDLDTEQLFVKALLAADNYTVSGTTLSLNKARMAPLAKFELQK